MSEAVVSEAVAVSEQNEMSSRTRILFLRIEAYQREADAGRLEPEASCEMGDASSREILSRIEARRKHEARIRVVRYLV